MDKQMGRGRRRCVPRPLNLEPLEDRELLSSLNVLTSSARSSPPPYDSQAMSSSIQGLNYGGGLGQPATNRAGGPANLGSSPAPTNHSGNHTPVLYDDRLSPSASHSDPKSGGQAALAGEQPYSKPGTSQETYNYSTQQDGQQAYFESDSSQQAAIPSTASTKPQSPERTGAQNQGQPGPSDAEGRLASEAFFAAVQAMAAPKAQERATPPAAVLRGAEIGPLLRSLLSQAAPSANPETGIARPRRLAEERELALTANGRPAIASPSAGLLAASLSPQGSNLLTNILPFDWPTAELALQKFFDQLDSLEEQLIDSRTPVGVMRWLAATMAITVTFDVTRRHLRKRAAPAGFPADGSNGDTWTWFPGMADPVSDG